MADIGSPTGVTLPVVETTLGPAWAILVNAYLLAHNDAIEAGVRTSIGLVVDSDIDYNGFEAQNLGKLVLTDHDTEQTTELSIYFRDGDLWCNDVNGTEVQITADGALNAAALGGIVGDYGGANPAKVTYTDSLSTYIFTQDPNVPAKIDCGDIKLRQTGVSSPNAITIKSPASLAAAYTITLPTALPALDETNPLLYMNTDGKVHTAYDPSLNSVTTSEPDIRHGIATLNIPATMMNSDGTAWAVTGDGLGWTITDTTVDNMYASCALKIGDAVVGADAFVQQSASTAALITAQLYEFNMATNTLTSKSDAMATVAATGHQTLAFTGIVPFTITTATVPMIKFTSSSGAGIKIIFGAAIYFARA